MELYDYQKNIIQKLRDSFRKGNRKIVLCSPTGSGKTVMFTYIIKQHIDKGGKVIVFTHRSELLTQAGGTFEHFGLKAEFITANSSPDLSKSLHVAMVETYNRRKKHYEDFIKSKTLIIFDEAHLQNFTKIMKSLPDNAVVIGATATPYRNHKDIQMGDFYTDLIQELDTQDIIDLGKLNPARSFGVPIDTTGMKKTHSDYDTSDYYEENKIYEGVVKNWVKHSENKKTILFASNIKSSKDVCNEFIRNGYNAKHIDGTMKNERKQIMKWFDETPNAIICNVGVLTAGFDQSDIETVILYRATTSLPLFLQMCGRGSRLHKGKDHFKILDFGNNIQRLGFWEDRRKWKLKYEKKSKKEQAAPVKICPKCDAVNFASALSCEICLYEFPKKKKTKEEVALEELNKGTLKNKRLTELSIDDLINLQITKQIKAQLVWRIMRTRGESTLYVYSKKMKYSQGWYYNQVKEIRSGNTGFTDFKIDFYEKERKQDSERNSKVVQKQLLLKI